MQQINLSARQDFWWNAFPSEVMEFLPIQFLIIRINRIYLYLWLSIQRLESYVCPGWCSVTVASGSLFQCALPAPIHCRCSFPEDNKRVAGGIENNSTSRETVFLLLPHVFMSTILQRCVIFRLHSQEKKASDRRRQLGSDISTWTPRYPYSYLIALLADGKFSKIKARIQSQPAVWWERGHFVASPIW